MLPDHLRIRDVRLRVADLERSRAFYRDLIGLTSVDRPGDTADFTPAGEGEPILQLRALPATTARPQYAIGLYHVALLYPDRASLARVINRLIATRRPFTGFSDHGVSEAAYLDDPDGNGLELYVDRPREAWPRQGTRIAMFTRPLDIEDLRRTAATGAEHGPRIGHIHLHVSDLQTARRFYHEAIGFDVMQDGYPGALFLAAGGYHHHLGLNTWARARAPATSAGLLDWTVQLGSAAAVATVAERVESLGYRVAHDDSGVRCDDGDGNVLVIIP